MGQRQMGPAGSGSGGADRLLRAADVWWQQIYCWLGGVNNKKARQQVKLREWRRASNDKSSAQMLQLPWGCFIFHFLPPLLLHLQVGKSREESGQAGDGGA